MFYELGNGEWNIPALRTLLEDVIPKHTTVVGYEIDHDFPFLGMRILSVNAREIHSAHHQKKMLLSIFDVTQERVLQAERETLIQQKDLLLKEMRHRVANSLQLIASILLLKARLTTSQESRIHLEDAHERIMSIATVQQQLEPTAKGENIVVGPCLTALCKSLSRTMRGARKSVTVEVEAGEGTVSSEVAVSLGLLTTELVINAFKHAFLKGHGGQITVAYKLQGSGWTLSVTDNGSGMSSRTKKRQGGLGTSIVSALATQLKAKVSKSSSSKGTSVSITRAKSAALAS